MHILNSKTKWAMLTLTALLSAQNAKAATSWFGYFNFESGVEDSSKNKQGHYNVSQVSTIFQHEFDIYQFLTEIEYANAPGFKDEGDGAGTNASDERSAGEISLERAYAKIEIDPMFTVKLGKDLTPTLWHTNHYPNLSVPVTKPQVLDIELFQENFIGFSISGQHASGFNYSIWSGNGRPLHKDKDAGANPPAHDFSDSSSSMISNGLRLGWNFNFGNDSSVYVGLLGANYVDFKNNSDSTNPERDDSKPTGFETSVAVGNFTLWSELASGKDKSGGYLVASYAVDIGKDKQLIPWMMYDSVKGSALEGINPTKFSAIGVNFKPKPNIVIKSEFSKSEEDTQDAKSAVKVGFIYFFI